MGIIGWRCEYGVRGRGPNRIGGWVDKSRFILLRSPIGARDKTPSVRHCPPRGAGDILVAGGIYEDSTAGLGDAVVTRLGKTHTRLVCKLDDAAAAWTYVVTNPPGYKGWGDIMRCASIACSTALK